MLNLESIFKVLEQWEGCFAWMYLDTKGLVTTGVGNLLATAEAACGLEWYYSDGRRASTPDVVAAWNAVYAAHSGMLAAYYARFTSIRLAPSEAKDLALHRLQVEFLPGLRRIFSGFDDYPEPAQNVLIDMEYNEGAGNLAKFHHLIEACEHHAWPNAVQECTISTSRKARNDWRQAQFASLSAPA